MTGYSGLGWWLVRSFPVSEAKEAQPWLVLYGDQQGSSGLPYIAIAMAGCSVEMDPVSETMV